MTKEECLDLPEKIEEIRYVDDYLVGMNKLQAERGKRQEAGL